jgi:hypothetical protein
LFDDVINEWSIQIDDNPFDSIDIWDGSFEYVLEVNTNLELHNVISHPLFQLEEVKELDNCIHTPLHICIFSFNNDDEFMGIPIFLNPLYFSLHYDDPIFDRKIETNGFMMFDESINPIFDIQTLNLKPKIFNPIDAFSVRCKDHLVGWHILKDGNLFFWVLICHSPSPYTSIG